MSCENLLTVSNQDMEVITSLVCSCYVVLMMVAKISGLKAHPCGGWLLAWQFWQFYASGGFWVHLKSYVYVHVMSLGHKSVR
jgi:hypothetical protein